MVEWWNGKLRCGWMKRERERESSWREFRTPKLLSGRTEFPLYTSSRSPPSFINLKLFFDSWILYRDLLSFDLSSVLQDGWLYRTYQCFALDYDFHANSCQIWNFSKKFCESSNSRKFWAIVIKLYTNIKFSSRSLGCELFNFQLLEIFFFFC